MPDLIVSHCLLDFVAVGYIRSSHWPEPAKPLVDSLYVHVLVVVVQDSV